MEQNAKNIAIEAFDYNLPEERIPKYPLEKRDESKLLVYNKNQVIDARFNSIPNYLSKDTLLIFNNSKVLPVRFHFKNENGATIEVFCLEAITEENTYAIWKCLVGKRKKWRNQTLTQHKNNQSIEVEIISQERDGYTIRFGWSDNIKDMEEVFQLFGSIPIPPYLKRETEEIDSTRYQNVYATHKGSVAAPTAGLHFTKNLLEQLKQENINTNFVTLHVGAGTFKPVKSDTLGGHEMHTEHMMVTPHLLEHLLEQIEAKKPITAVGTTSLRTLESLYWLGNKLIQNPELSTKDFIIGQWEPYEGDKQSTNVEAIKTLLKHLETTEETQLSFSTSLLVLPSYTFRIIDSLVTNFHQPKSTLLLLIAAIIGDDWKKIYQHALNNDYRFLSYGDSSLLFLNQQE